MKRKRVSEPYVPIGKIRSVNELKNLKWLPENLKMTSSVYVDCLVKGTDKLIDNVPHEIWIDFPLTIKWWYTAQLDGTPHTLLQSYHDAYKAIESV